MTAVGLDISFLTQTIYFENNMLFERQFPQAVTTTITRVQYTINFHHFSPPHQRANLVAFVVCAASTCTLYYDESPAMALSGMHKKLACTRASL
jgi:hypothetical protein